MTCKVKVTAPNGSSTRARAVSDPGSPTSFVHERIAQLLNLPRRKKNVMVEGVGGITTPTRGSVLFQVSGIQDDAEKIGVEAYLLKKVTKDLPLHPISLALKWDHTSALQLADPEFRTRARIDLLLMAGVFTSILRDGRRTGPLSMPFAINTCLGWVLFGMIQDSDVVDVANPTLEQDEINYTAGSGRSYADVVTAYKKKGRVRYRVKAATVIYVIINFVMISTECPQNFERARGIVPGLKRLKPLSRHEWTLLPFGYNFIIIFISEIYSR